MLLKWHVSTSDVPYTGIFDLRYGKISVIPIISAIICLLIFTVP